MDLLYTLRPCNICEELVYSLRSAVNLPYDHIIFVGGFPNNIRRSSIIHIPTLQNNTKWKNALQNVKIACRDSRLSDNFILMNDDFFILNPIKDVEYELCLNLGITRDVYDRYCAAGRGQTDYAKGLKETEQFLQRLGIANPLSFELHIPMIFNKDKFLKMFELPGIDDIAVLHWRTVYGNLYYKNSRYHPDVKIYSQTLFGETDSAFLSSSDLGWKKVKPFLDERFSNKTIYEF